MDRAERQLIKSVERVEKRNKVKKEIEQRAEKEERQRAKRENLCLLIDNSKGDG